MKRNCPRDHVQRQVQFSEAEERCVEELTQQAGLRWTCVHDWSFVVSGNWDLRTVSNTFTAKGNSLCTNYKLTQCDLNACFLELVLCARQRVLTTLTPMKSIIMKFLMRFSTNTHVPSQLQWRNYVQCDSTGRGLWEACTWIAMNFVPHIFYLRFLLK